MKRDLTFFPLANLTINTILESVVSGKDIGALFEDEDMTGPDPMASPTVSLRRRQRAWSESLLDYKERLSR